MKVVILAGGKGLRLSEKTKSIPKPLVEVNNKPIIEHIISYFSKFGLEDFYIMLGYKSNLIKSFFVNYYNNNSDIKIDYSQNKIEIVKKKKINWKVTLIESGLESMTGGRIKYFKRYLNRDDEFFLTYSDALSDLNINKFINNHKKHNYKNSLVLSKLKARFGKADIDPKKKLIRGFYEKNDNLEPLVNSGYYIFNKKIFDYIKKDNCILESEVLPKLAKKRLLNYYEHKGFWQPMDNIRERDLLENYLQNNYKFLKKL